MLQRTRMCSKPHSQFGARARERELSIPVAAGTAHPQQGLDRREIGVVLKWFWQTACCSHGLLEAHKAAEEQQNSIVDLSVAAPFSLQTAMQRHRQAWTCWASTAALRALA